MSDNDRLAKAIDTALDVNQRALVCAALIAAVGGNCALAVPDPLYDVPVDQRDRVRELLISLMPRGTVILDLWNWDLHFEADLDDDWLADAALGPDDSLDDAADILAEYFLEKARDYGIETGFTARDEAEEFIREEATTFVSDWRSRIIDTLLPEHIRLRPVHPDEADEQP